MSGLSMRKILIFASLIVCQVPLAHATDYYIDSSSTGTNQGTYDNPWKSIAWNAPVNTVTFAPGDRILFRRGRTYNGALTFGGGGQGGTEQLPLVIDSYGRPGDPLTKPILAGGGVAGGTIELKNKRWTTVQNLEITNWPADPTVEGSSAGVRMGIRLTIYTPGTWSGIRIKNNTFRKIRGITDRGGLYGNAALHAIIADNSYTADANGNVLTGAKWDDFLVEGNDFSENTCIGILFKSPSYLNMTDTAKWGTNVRIRENTFQDMGADLILLNGLDAPLVEYNKGYDAGLYGTRGYVMIAGMWTCYKTQNTLFQYNEVAYTINEFENGISGDSKAFDVDYGTQGNHIFQYNYTHHNEGGVLIIMPREQDSAPINDWYKTTIYRYNLSVNDGRNTGSCSQFGIYPVLGKSSAHIYNNVFYSTLPEGFKFSNAQACYYTNNIFYMPSAIYPTKPWFSHNAYYGHVPEVNDSHKVVADPKFVSPFPAGAGGDGDVLANTNIFKLQATSPLINAGKAITVTPAATVDYWGNAVNQGLPDIGAYEYPSGASLPAAPNTVATTIIEDPLNLPTVAYGGTWNRVINDGQYHGGNQSSASTNAWVEVTFTGTNFTLFGKRSPSLGKMNVTLDNESIGVADAYWPIEEFRKELFQVTNLAPGQHKIRFTAAGKNNHSSGTWVGIDYFEILPVNPPVRPVATVIDNTVGTHSAGWETASQGDRYYGKTRSKSVTVGSYIDYTFTGTGLRIFAPRAADRGKYTVTIDGGSPVTVDQFSPVSYDDHIDDRMKQFEVNGLANTSHTVRIAVSDVTGGKQVIIDWLEALVGGAPAAPVLVDTSATAPGMTWGGSWTHGADSLYHNSTKSVANIHNAYAQLSFTGTSAKLFVKRAPNLGRLNISVDGGSPTLVDCNATTTTYKYQIFSISGLTPGTHTIKATIYDPTNTYKYVGLDYFEYQP
jgi:hypothetical protein